MAAQWDVTQNHGDRAHLMNAGECQEVERPSGMSEEEFLELLRPGTIILDRVVQQLSEF